MILNSFKKFLLIFLILTFPLVSANVEDDNNGEPVRIEILHEHTSIKPGEPFWVALRVNLEKDWHTYWKNPGVTGVPLFIEWKMPKGFTTSPISWPTPKKFISNDIIGYGYEGETIFLTQVTPPREFDQKSAEISAEIRWLACSSTTCMPGESSTTVTIDVLDVAPSMDNGNKEIFKVARENIPVPHNEAKAYRYKDDIELNLSFPNNLNHVTVHFIPEEKGIVHNPEELRHSSNKVKIFLKVKPEVQIESLKGVAILNGEQQHSVEINVPLEGGNEDTIALADVQPNKYSEEEGTSLGFVLILAFTGGLILNLMPCVLPVMSFKILSFIKMAGKKQSLIFKHGLSFACGVLISFWVLAGFLLILKAYGSAVGWGFQLQEPLFVAFLAVILFGFGLSLFGVFEAGNFMASLAGKAQTSHAKEGLFSSFLSGVLATALATPCTGPFLGSAVGFALSAPAFSAMLIFTFLGLGMALPYLLLSAYPTLLKFLPRPGDWMNTFKEVMGFVMMATVLWLVWVFNAQTNSFSLMLFLISLFFVAIACWIYGKWGAPICSKVSRFLSIASATSCLVWSGYLIYAATSPSVLAISTENSSQEEIAWEKFSPERVAELQSKGTPVLIDFTAKWCLICQANHLILSAKEVEKKLDELGVVRMKADWTKNDPTITQELKKHGRSGVPLYVLYGKNAEDPAILPQILTPEIVLNRLKELE